MAKRRNGLWTQVVLNTGGGHFVHTQNIPPFNAPPDVLIWGARVFTHKATVDDCEVYEEAWAYALVAHPGVPKAGRPGVHSPENVVDIPGDVAPTYLQLSPENEMRVANAPAVTAEGGEGPDMETRIVDDECHVISCPALPWPFATQEKLELWCEFHSLPVPGEPWLARCEPAGITLGERPEAEVTMNKIPERAHAEPSPIHGDVIQYPVGHKASIGDAPRHKAGKAPTFGDTNTVTHDPADYAEVPVPGGCACGLCGKCPDCLAKAKVSYEDNRGVSPDVSSEDGPVELLDRIELSYEDNRGVSPDVSSEDKPALSYEDNRGVSPDVSSEDKPALSYEDTTTPEPVVTKVPGVPYPVRFAPPVDAGYPVYPAGQRPGGKRDTPPEGFSEGPLQSYEPISAMGPNGLTFHGPVGYEPTVHGDPELKAADEVKVELPQDWPEGTVTTTYDPEAAYLERINEQPRGLTDWEARVLAMAYAAARKHSGSKPLPWPFQCMEELIAWCDQHGLPYPEGTYTTIPPDHYEGNS